LTSASAVVPTAAPATAMVFGTTETSTVSWIILSIVILSWKSRNGSNKATSSVMTRGLGERHAHAK
jgi:hypothetical protein